MSTASTAFQLTRLVLILILLIVAALLATPPGRLPLALRGLAKILHRDSLPLGTDPKKCNTDGAAVKLWRRWTAFLLVLVAMVVALI